MKRRDTQGTATTDAGTVQNSSLSGRIDAFLFAASTH
jgi:hypothetical protein